MDYSLFSNSVNDAATIYSTSPGSSSAFFAIFIVFFVFFFILGLTLSVLLIIAQWKIFVKAGQEGWKAIIPIYNTIVLFKIIGLSGWLVLLYLLVFIPYIGSMLILTLNIIVSIKLSKAFGKPGIFSVGLIFFAPLFYLILALDGSTYIGNSVNNNDNSNNDSISTL